MIVEVRHCAQHVDILVSEDPVGIGPSRQFALRIQQVERNFEVALDTGDSIDFDPTVSAELRKPHRLYTHRSTYK